MTALARPSRSLQTDGPQPAPRFPEELRLYGGPALKIIAHRAKGFGYLENMIGGVRCALDNGFVAEVDVCMTARGPVLSHDAPIGNEPTLDALAKALRGCGRDVLIHAKDAASIRAAAAAFRCPPRIFGAGRSVMRGHMIEVDAEERLVELGTRSGIVVTDDSEWLAPLHVLKIHHHNCEAFVAGHNIFGVNERRWGELIDMGVDGILTDEPCALRSFVKESGP